MRLSILHVATFMRGCVGHVTNAAEMYLALARDVEASATTQDVATLSLQSTKTIATSTSEATSTESTVVELASTTSSATFNIYTLPGAPPGPTYDPPIPSPPTEPVYLFSFGDSYSSTGFRLNETLPTPDNPFGNPDYPGDTTRAGLVLWISYLTLHSNTTILNYNFAAGGMVITNHSEEPYDPDLPSFEVQVNTFVDEVATTPRPAHAPWTADNSIFVIWFGHNDVLRRVLGKRDESVYDTVVAAFDGAVRKLVDAGARRIFIMSAPALWREPWFYNLASRTQLELDVTRFDSMVLDRLDQLARERPELSLHHFDVRPAQHRVLDDPTTYGANDSSCFNWHPEDPALISWTCLWQDKIHPGIPMHESIGAAVRDELRVLGWLAPLPGSFPPPAVCEYAVCLSWLQLALLLSACLVVGGAAYLCVQLVLKRRRSKYQPVPKEAQVDDMDESGVEAQSPVKMEPLQSGSDAFREDSDGDPSIEV